MFLINLVYNGSYPKGLIVAFKLKSIQPEGSTEENGTDKVQASDGNVNEGDGKKASENDNEGKSADVEEGNGGKVDEDHTEETDGKAAADAIPEGEVKVTKGSSAESGDKKNVSANDKNVVTREDLKEIFQKFGTVKV